MYKKVIDFVYIDKITRNGLSVDHNAEFIKGLEYVCNNDVPGDFFDIGCWTGTVSLFAATFFKLNNINKKIYLFDTFEGHLPKQRTEKDSTWGSDLQPFYNVNIEEINKAFEIVGYNNYEIVKGDIFNTLPGYKTHSISFASLDLNYYTPTKFALEFLHSNNFKGVIFEDDYENIEGITDAFNENINIKKNAVLKSVRGGFFNF